MSSALDKKKLETIEILIFSKEANALKNELRAETKLRLKTDDSTIPYGSEDCMATFIEEEFPSQGFIDKFRGTLLLPNSLPAQRFLIAFGDDRLNHEAARWLREQLGEHFGALATDAPPTIIDFAIEDNEFFKVLKGEYLKTVEEPIKKEQTNIREWCLMRPFSTMEECFSYSNIRLDDLEQRAMVANCIHTGESQPYDKTNMQVFLSDYMWGSSVAIALHTLYKTFCRTSSEPDSNLYKMMLSADEAQRECFENQIYWLEHCRWLTYMRSCGYRCPKAKEFIAMVYKDGVTDKDKRKNHDLRLHACMLESDGAYYSLEELEEMSDKFYHGRQQGVNTLKEAIAQMDETTDDTEDLDTWLNRTILPGAEDVDALDRLSLFVALTMETEKRVEFKGFKTYDTEISKELYRQILRRKCKKCYEDYQKNSAVQQGENDSRALRAAVEQLVDTWPKDHRDEIGIVKKKEKMLLLVRRDSHWLNLKLLGKVTWKGFGWCLIAVSGEYYSENKNADTGKKDK